MGHFVRFLHEWLNSFLSRFLINIQFFVFICVDNLGDALLPWLHQMKEHIFHLVWVFIGLDLSHEQQKKLSPVCCCSYGNLGYQAFKREIQN